MNYLKQNHLSILIIAFLVVSAFFGGSHGSLFGGTRADLTTVSNPWTFTNNATDGGVTLASTTSTSLKVGQTGNKITSLNYGTCNIFTGTISPILGAGEMRYVDCQAGTATQSALNNVVASDNVRVQFATTTGATKLLGGLQILGVSASSTPGFITLNLYNASTSAVTLTSAATSSLLYQVFH